jgi:hypothetical protein
MFRYCLECDARLPEYIWYANDFLCDECDDRRWQIQDDEDEDDAEDCE